MNVCCRGASIVALQHHEGISVRESRGHYRVAGISIYNADLKPGAYSMVGAVMAAVRGMAAASCVEFVGYDTGKV